jgi:flagellar basal-body rod modification protein FlgD
MQTVQSTTTNQTVTSPAPTTKTTLGKNDFMNLLITQMQNQDPMDPMSGSDYAAQLAQFSSLEQLTNINDNLTLSLGANSALSSSINNALAATFIGKNVRATAGSFQFNGTDSVNLGYNLPSSADNTTISIYDGAGNLVKTINGKTNQGDNSSTWDGTNNNGQSVGSGTYTFQVSANDNAGAPLTASEYIYGTVSGVRYTANGTVFVVDGQEIPLSDILEIMQ